MWVADINAEGAAAVARGIEEEEQEGKGVGASATPYAVGGCVDSRGGWLAG